jgi:hypothetical protein
MGRRRNRFASVAYFRSPPTGHFESLSIPKRILTNVQERSLLGSDGSNSWNQQVI